TFWPPSRVTNQALLLSSPRVSTATAPGLKSTSAGRSHSMMCAAPSCVVSGLLVELGDVVWARATPAPTASAPRTVSDFVHTPARIAFLPFAISILSDRPAEACNRVTCASRYATFAETHINADARFVSASTGAPATTWTISLCLTEQASEYGRAKTSILSGDFCDRGPLCLP